MRVSVSSAFLAHTALFPSNLLISSGGHNFFTPSANFCDHLEGLFHQISKKKKKNSPLKELSHEIGSGHA
jgi:hypothetical protein